MTCYQEWCALHQGERLINSSFVIWSGWLILYTLGTISELLLPHESLHYDRAIVKSSWIPTLITICRMHTSTPNKMHKKIVSNHIITPHVYYHSLPTDHAINWSSSDWVLNWRTHCQTSQHYHFYECDIPACMILHSLLVNFVGLQINCYGLSQIRIIVRTKV